MYISAPKATKRKATKRKATDCFKAQALRATVVCWLIATAITGMNIITLWTIESVTSQDGTGAPIR